MRNLVQEARLALNAQLVEMAGDDALREIIRVGTSAGGALMNSVHCYPIGGIAMP